MQELLLMHQSLLSGINYGKTSKKKANWPKIPKFPKIKLTLSKELLLSMMYLINKNSLNMKKKKPSKIALSMETFLDNSPMKSNKMPKEKYSCYWIQMSSMLIRNPSPQKQLLIMNWPFINNSSNTNTNAPKRKAFAADKRL